MAILASPTLGKLIFNIRNFLNQPNAQNSIWSDAELTEYLNEGIRMHFQEVVHDNEGLFTAKANMNITADAETIALPVDFFQIKAVRKKINNGFEILSYRSGITEGYSTQGGTTSDSFFPSYSLRGNSLVLHPVPNFSETAGLELEYLQFPDTMVHGGDAMTAQVSPIFKQLIEMYAVYKAKLKESLVNGVAMHTVAEQNLGDIYKAFKEAVKQRSKNPTYVIPFNPETG